MTAATCRAARRFVLLSSDQLVVQADGQDVLAGVELVVVV
jgi:hypothetical protein